MLVFLFCLIIFCFAFFMHVVIWRFRIPKRQTMKLLLVFVVCLLLGNFVLYFLSFYKGCFKVVNEHPYLIFLQITSLYLSLMLSYLCTFPAIAANSPTLLILKMISQAKSEGLDKSAIGEALNDDFLVRPRIEELANEKMICFTQDKYQLTKRGSFIVRIFIFYRHLLKLPLGG